ncbi:hypothetical protein [Bradyrhizobium japonicum]|uniref:hypothetical protein n=1 Tax=Bradyrhizobium japonicum TaxID=375 RepID=UPI0027155E56|nr:hypothetical protein [Bradyrhizobium japonicum]WLB24370.1 hypothetical protein QIH95_48480 [Bradyrhizobium japonicum]
MALIVHWATVANKSDNQAKLGLLDRWAHSANRSSFRSAFGFSQQDLIGGNFDRIQYAATVPEEVVRARSLMAKRLLFYFSQPGTSLAVPASQSVDAILSL